MITPVMGYGCLSERVFLRNNLIINNGNSRITIWEDAAEPWQQSEKQTTICFLTIITR